MGIDFLVTSNADEFRKFKGAKINYNETISDDAINITPYPLLFENEICEQKTEVKNHPEWNKIFFENLSDIPFDIFAASFFLLSRYEEYLPHKNDEHGRYSHEQSCAGKNNFIEIPLVDTWAQQLKEKVLRRFPSTDYQQNHFKFLSTIDLDFAYKYKGISFARQAMKFCKSLLQGHFNDCIEQIKVVSGVKKDPYDTYDFIQNIADQNSLPLKYFILMRTGTKHDKNIVPESETMKTLVKKLSKNNETGLHPSYFSDGENKLKEEKKLLEKSLQKNISNSRQHFLKFSLPQTYRQLINCGFTADYSMAYSTVCGFRASTSFPFYFFDLVKNEQTNFIIYPTTLMDVTLKNYQRLSPGQALNKIEQLMNEVKKVNGTFISLWHNSNLCEDKEWIGWREVFEKLHTLATIKNTP